MNTSKTGGYYDEGMKFNCFFSIVLYMGIIAYIVTS